jgi:hypothetical protein
VLIFFIGAGVTAAGVSGDCGQTAGVRSSTFCLLTLPLKINKIN